MIGIYVRVSTVSQINQYSIPVQIQRGMSFADTDDFQIYKETGSGSDIVNRPEINKMIDDIKKGIVNKVWVIDNDRLTRELSDAILLQKVFSSHNVELYINDTYTDFSTPEKILQYHITSAVAQYERSQITERSIRGKTEWQNTGNMVLPKLYGWQYKYAEDGTKKWYTVDSEVETIKLIYKLYLGGKNLNQIRLHLWNNGYRNRKGNEIARFTVKKILTQTLYIGKSWTTDGLEIDSNVYSPIIDETIFYQVQSKIDNRPKGNHRFLPAKHELSGVVKCHYCNKPFYYNGKQNKINLHEYYYHAKPHCGKLSIKSLKRDRVELAIKNYVFDLLMEKEDDMWDWLQSYRSKSAIEREGLQALATTLSTKIKDIKKGKGVLLELAVDGTLSKDDIKDKMANFNSDEKKYTNELNYTYTQLKSLSAGTEDEELKLIYKLAIDYEDLSSDQRREFYRKLFKSIEIDNRSLILTMFNGDVDRVYIDRS